MEAERADRVDPADFALSGSRVDRAHEFLDRIGTVNWRPWLALAAVALVVVVGVFALGVRTGAPPPLTLPRVASSTVEDRPTPTTEPVHVHVHVAGEVEVPGLYRAPEGSRVAELVEAAGGPTADGDVDRLNLAAVPRDGERIEVPAFGAPLSTRVEAAADATIDVNVAAAGELEALPGIGPSLAAAIVQYRNRHGPFGSVNDLVAVPGIGPATVERLRQRATV